MKNIVLIGMMGSGKSTCARLLATRLSLRPADMDRIIESRAGRAVADIFAQEGEEAFRALESALAEELGAMQGLAIACGGGAPLRPENVAALRQNGVLAYLNRPPEEIFALVSMQGRPLAQSGRESFLQLAARRDPVYRAAADVIITDFSGPEATVLQILEKCEALL